ncbi:hypothetical protein BJV85_001596 [Clostridium acetobutylicum]|uniref:Uncharacterized protein, similar to protein from Clostridium histolyticum (GI:3892648) n=1 Tax=Clostridium acetobutylicum (strain ATCC 824 / DSM 792 / JCM 1419 / IAM 19013 / LMG 5710 / NBRC 13948 / NRRL B-527 / VKM B-1787 / 2291 / W) TaxID=272562 RepID=Q97GS9_CLOAB|nr:MULTISPECIES: hypothetical protein [Clostridium]AAK80243.1 Uncharacterized protein, similar to protein from Clostridium histolyticum (GI:3892648) [Clostridium acetobutylicum ATCC 824]ADZ21339.1 Conserved hypothetical protein [Clostridium acetobutylicum EA 2018]AEI32263.1 hypothetical protein SMB_G2320 [Clostridium acetobutylicum DSM 1731]AWV79333.1 hypothetical protein DK921_04320 [Clostridium acetobutylicum]KHD38427.1 hypothetical protein NL50_02655 [Clostridium acetobutylicum]
MTLKKKVILSVVALLVTFIFSFCIGYRGNLIKIMNAEKYKISKGIDEFLGRNESEKARYTSNNKEGKKTLALLIVKQNYDITFDPEDETKNNVLTSSEETNAEKEHKAGMTKEQITRSYEKQGYIVIWDNDMKVEVIKNRYINNHKVDGVFILNKDKNSDKINVYKVDDNGSLIKTNEQAYISVNQLKNETRDLLRKGFLVFGSKEDAKKLAGYD